MNSSKPVVAIAGVLLAFTGLALALTGLAVTGWLPVVPCFFQTGYVPIEKQQLRGTGQIYFVPLDDFSRATARALTQHYQEKYGLSIETTTPIALPESTFDEARQQYVAESIVAVLRSEQRFSSLFTAPEVAG